MGVCTSTTDKGSGANSIRVGFDGRRWDPGQEDPEATDGNMPAGGRTASRKVPRNSKILASGENKPDSYLRQATNTLENPTTEPHGPQGRRGKSEKRLSLS